MKLYYFLLITLFMKYNVHNCHESCFVIDYNVMNENSKCFYVKDSPLGVVGFKSPKLAHLKEKLILWFYSKFAVPQQGIKRKRRGVSERK